MKEQDNLNLVKETYLAYRDRDMPALLRCLATDVKWFSLGLPDIIPTAGTRYGRSQVEYCFSTLTGAARIDRFEPREFIAQGDMVVAIGDVRRRLPSTGELVNSPWIHVFRIDRGKITEVRSFYDTAAAFLAFESATVPPVTATQSEKLGRSFL